MVSAFLAFSAVAANAQTDTYWSDYQGVLNVFRAGDSGPGLDVSVKALAQVMEGIAGKWVPISALAPKIGDDAAISKACGFLYIEASQTSPFSFLLVRKSTRKPEHMLEYRFTFIQGYSFQRHVDDTAFIKYLGLDKPGTPVERQMSVLRFVNGTVDVYRPARDFLVVKEMLGQTEIYGRCR